MKWRNRKGVRSIQPGRAQRVCAGEEVAKGFEEDKKGASPKSFSARIKMSPPATASQTTLTGH